MDPQAARELARNAAALCARLSGPGAGEALRRLTALDSDLSAATVALAAADLNAALDLVGTLREYWVAAGRQAAALELVGPIVAAAGAEACGPALVCAGTLAFFSGDNDRAAAYHERAAERAGVEGDLSTQADALIGLARVAMQRGEHVRMAELASRSAQIAERLGDLPRLAVALHHQAVSAQLQGLPEGAGLHRRTLDLQRRLGNRRGVALELLNLGLAELNAGRPEAAQAMLAEALTSFEELAVARNVALCTALLGVAAAGSHQPERAARLLGRGLALRRAMQTTFTAGADSLIDRALAACEAELGKPRLEALLAGA